MLHKSRGEGVARVPMLDEPAITANAPRACALPARFAAVEFAALSLLICDRAARRERQALFALGLTLDGRRRFAGYWSLDARADRAGAVVDDLIGRGLRDIHIAILDDGLQDVQRKLSERLRPRTLLASIKAVANRGKTASASDATLMRRIGTAICDADSPAGARLDAELTSALAEIMMLPRPLRRVLYRGPGLSTLREKLQRQGVALQTRFPSTEAANAYFAAMPDRLGSDWRVAPNLWRAAAPALGKVQAHIVGAA